MSTGPALVPCDAAVPTHQPASAVLAQVNELLAAIDHDRSGLSAESRLELVDQAGLAARRIEALRVVLVAEAGAAQASLVARGTPLTAYLSAEGHTSARDAAGLVASGRDVSTRAATKRAVLDGGVSVRQARAIDRALGDLPASLTDNQRDHAERLLLELSSKLTPGLLAQQTQHVLEAVAPPGLDVREAEQRRLASHARQARNARSLLFWSDARGSVLFRGSLPELDAAGFIRLIEARVESTRRGAAADRLDPLAEHPTPQQRRADALVSLVADWAAGSVGEGGEVGRGHAGAAAEAAPAAAVASGTPAVAQGRRPTVAGDRPRVVVMMQEESLRQRAEQAGVLMTGARISAGDLRRLCCDADIVPVVLGTRSELLDVGEAHRLVPAPIRRALSLRDRGCAFPGCQEPDSRCEAHHIIPWYISRRTALDLLVLLCPFHHSHVEPPRFWQGPPPDRWEVRMNHVDGLPEFLPPARMDPERRPIRHARHPAPA